jgi:DNA-binding CsgD family transcriptional regulator/tetratricopeptide (TPR) repeat protein
LQGLRGGAAAVLVIEGEAGIGKTELARHLTREAAAAGTLVWRGEAHALERNRPFGALVDALDLRQGSTDPRRAHVGRLILGDVGADSSGGRGVLGDLRFGIVEEIVALLEATCSGGPVVLSLEDLHWADDSTLMAVGAILRQLPHVPLVVVATLRPAPRSPGLDVLLDDCVTAGAHLLRLQPLDFGDVETLVRQELGGTPGALLSAIVSRAAGNPLLVVELLRSLIAEGWLKRDGELVEAAADELPSTLRDLVLRRLRYLPALTLDLLQLASVLGEAVSIQALAVVARRHTTEVAAGLTEAFRGKLLDEQDDTVAFRHQLIQQAIYEDLPAAVRKAMHRDAAGALARSGASSSTVAGHVLLGAEPGDLEAVRWLRQAAAEAAAGAPSVAVDLIRRAAELLPAGHKDRDLIGSELAAALMRAGQVAEAAGVAAEVLDRPHRADVDVALQLTLVDALSLQNRARELVDRAEAALRTPSLRPDEQALVLTQASYGQFFSGEFVAGQATARRALDVAERSGSTEMTCWSLCALSVAVKTQGRYREALSIARQAVALAVDPQDPGAQLRHPHFFLGMALTDADEFDEARGAYARAVEDAEQLGTGWLLPDMLLQAAELRFIMGDWDDAASELEAGLDLAERHGQRITVPQSWAYLSLIALCRGDLPSARRALGRLDASAPAEQRFYGMEMVAVARAAIAEAEGHHASALDVLLRAWSYDLDRGIRYWDRYLGPAMVRLGVALGRTDVAGQVVSVVEAGASLASGVPTAAAAAHRCRGLLENDAESLLHAVDLARRGRRVLDLAGACEDAASVLVAAGDPDRAKDVLEEALAEYERVEAISCVARVAAVLRRLGVRRGTRGPRRRPERGWGSLTESERAVSLLVAEGLTNREVARHLYISPHTVNTHLRHVFQKLSVSTRAELAAKVARNDNDHAFK